MRAREWRMAVEAEIGGIERKIDKITAEADAKIIGLREAQARFRALLEKDAEDSTPDEE